VRRPRSGAAQREHYSGKKKRHTVKTEYLITTGGRIASVSRSYPGSHHDPRIRRAGPRLPVHVHLYGDSACQGYDKAHSNIDFPYKKPKKGELSGDEKACNTGLSRLRVAVEHRIGRAKRFRIVSEPLPQPAADTCHKDIHRRWDGDYERRVRGMLIAAGRGVILAAQGLKSCLLSQRVY